MQLRFQSYYFGWLKPVYYFENATACSKRKLKTTVATQLKSSLLNFTNLLHEAFTRTDPKNAKNTVKLSVFFCAFRIYTNKSFRKTLMKLTPDTVATVATQLKAVLRHRAFLW